MILMIFGSREPTFGQEVEQCRAQGTLPDSTRVDQRRNVRDMVMEGKEMKRDNVKVRTK